MATYEKMLADFDKQCRVSGKSKSAGSSPTTSRYVGRRNGVVEIHHFHSSPPSPPPVSKTVEVVEVHHFHGPSSAKPVAALTKTVVRSRRESDVFDEYDYFYVKDKASKTGKLHIDQDCCGAKVKVHQNTVSERRGGLSTSDVCSHCMKSFME